MKVFFEKPVLITSFASLLSLCACAEGQSPQNLVDSCTAINHDYALARDRADVDAYSALFTSDAEFVMQGESFVGLDKILQRLSGGSSNFARLLITTIDITPIDSTTATGVTYFTMFQAADAENPKPPIRDYSLFMGEYHDNYEMTSSGCKFTRRETLPLFWGTEEEN